MDQLICASLSHTHYWYEVGMLKVPATDNNMTMLLVGLSGTNTYVRYKSIYNSPTLPVRPFHRRWMPRINNTKSSLARRPRLTTSSPVTWVVSSEVALDRIMRPSPFIYTHKNAFSRRSRGHRGKGSMLAEGVRESTHPAPL